MAQQKGHVSYVGTLGEVRHFKIKGQQGFYAGLKGGPSAERVKNGAEFVRTRENNNEFGGCAKFGRNIRYTFPGLIRNLGDSKVGNRLLKASKKINLGDAIGVRGYREIALTKNQSVLKGMDLNIETPLDSVVKLKFNLETVSRTEAVLSLDQFCAIDNLTIPRGATHFRFVLALGVVSDYAFDRTSESYQPLNEPDNGQSKVVYTDYLSTRSIVNALTLECRLSNPIIGANSSALQLVGIEFYQLSGTEYYPLGNGNALKIIQVV